MNNRIKRNDETGEKWLTCNCGEEYFVYGAEDVFCDCGRIYNCFGQALANPKQWGEETNEAFGSRGEYLGEGHNYNDDY